MSGTVQQVTNLLRSWGVVVNEWAGCWGRTAGGTPDFAGGIVHHTGSGTAPGYAYATLVNGRSDLSGPLCNFAGNADGSLTVIASGVANHAGASGGRSMGPLPKTGSFNRRVMGLEIVYPGNSPMNGAQYKTAGLWAKAVAQVCAGGNIESIRAHAETSITGKWDPGYAPGKTIDMNQFRRDAAGSGSSARPVTTKAGPMEQLTPKVLASGAYRFHMSLSNWDSVDGYYMSMSCGWSGCSFMVFVKKASGAYVAVPSEMPSGSYGKVLAATLAADDVHWLGLPDGAQSFSVEITPSTGDGVPSVSLFTDLS
jgi:hypothetical protein